MEIHEGDESFPATASSATVAISASGRKSSEYSVRWALENFIPKGTTSFKLLHVRRKIKMIPTPMGNLLPISEVREDVVAAYRKEVEWETNTKLLPLKKMCAQRKVNATNCASEEDYLCPQRKVKLVVSVIEGDDVADAISQEVAKSQIKILVVGSSGIIISRRRRPSQRICCCVPNFCTVYQILKGKLSSVHPASTLKNKSSIDIRNDSSSTEAANDGRFLMETQSSISGQVSTSFNQTDASSPDQSDLDLELDKLRIELGRVCKMSILAQDAMADAHQKVTELSTVKTKEVNMLNEITSKVEIAEEHAQNEKKKRESAEREAEFAQKCVMNEILRRRFAEMLVANEVKRKHKLERSLEKLDQKYKKFSWEEIVSATSSFSDSLKIGSGSCGTVYKCNLHHTAAAVKVLHLNDGCKTKQFQTELDVLTQIRHPHVLLLIGACPEHGCLVYEFMANGSLEDRLFRKENSPPIPWFHRLRIAWEIASALAFLHNSEPKPIVHRDLKPANILLDHNFVSKIGDVGVSMLLPADHATKVHKNTSFAGTFCYIDPEYQRTGLVSPMSDLYALGMVMLQLLTAKPAIGLPHLVETTLLEDKLEDILDHSAGKWPLTETQELANLCLGCLEIRRCDRPHLEGHVLPMLERLKGIGDLSGASVLNVYQ